MDRNIQLAFRKNEVLNRAEFTPPPQEVVAMIDRIFAPLHSNWKDTEQLERSPNFGSRRITLGWLTKVVSSALTRRIRSDRPVSAGEIPDPSQYEEDHMARATPGKTLGRLPKHLERFLSEIDRMPIETGSGLIAQKALPARLQRFIDELDELPAKRGYQKSTSGMLSKRLRRFIEETDQLPRPRPIHHWWREQHDLERPAGATSADDEDQPKSKTVSKIEATFGAKRIK